MPPFFYSDFKFPSVNKAILKGSQDQDFAELPVLAHTARAAGRRKTAIGAAAKTNVFYTRPLYSVRPAASNAM